MDKGDNTEPGQDGSGGGRRQSERRQAEAGYDGPERRKHERRSGTDRRATPRDDGQGGSEG